MVWEIVGSMDYSAYGFTEQGVFQGEGFYSSMYHIALSSNGVAARLAKFYQLRQALILYV